MASSNRPYKKRRIVGNEEDLMSPDRDIGMRLPVRCTTRVSHLEHLSQTIMTCLTMHTHITWSWFMETAPLRQKMQAITTEEDATREGHTSLFAVWSHYFHKITSLLSVAVMRQSYLKTHIYYCTDQVQRIREIRPVDRPVPALPARQKRTISSLSDQEAYQWTGFTKPQLSTLLVHLRLPEKFKTRSKYCYAGEECLIMALTFIRTGLDWVTLALEGFFGGDARRSTELFEWFIDYIHHTFYNAITGSSMNIWVSQIDSFRRAIWQSFTEPLLNKQDEPVQFDCDFEDWRVALFIDCTTQVTCRPGGGAHYNNEEINEYISQCCQHLYWSFASWHLLQKILSGLWSESLTEDECHNPSLQYLLRQTIWYRFTKLRNASTMHVIHGTTLE